MNLLLPSVEIGVGKIAALVGNLASLVLDYVARQKIGGVNTNYFHVKQLPVLAPDVYDAAIQDYIVPRVLELTYTANDLAFWARDLGFAGAPFVFNLDRRAILRAELDACYARLYGLSRDELRYILDPAEVLGEDYPSQTFRVLKNNEMREFGEYRTARLVLREFDRMALSEAAHEPYQSLLVPPPGQQSPLQYASIGVIRDEDDARLAGLIIVIIRQAGALPRQHLALALAATHTIGTAINLMEQPEADRFSAYYQLHETMFFPARMERLQTLLQFLESSGAIRVEQQGARIAAVPDVPLPTGVLIEQGIEEVASILLRAAHANIERQATGELDVASQPSTKQA